MINVEEIKLRQDAVEELFKNLMKRDSINNTLSKINDIERLCGRVSYNSLVPNDCVALRTNRRRGAFLFVYVAL